MRPLQERQRLCDSIGVKNFVFFHDKLRIGASMDRQTTTLLNGLPERVSEVVWQIVLPQDFVQLIDCAVVVDAGFEATLSLEQCLPRSSGISPPGHVSRCPIARGRSTASNTACGVKLLETRPAEL